MNKINIGKALENPNVAKALSEFTVEMMNNSEITEYLKGIINGNQELGSSSTKLIEAIKRYKENLLKKVKMYLCKLSIMTITSFNFFLTIRNN
jgi:dihydroxyacetone kinase DhaKLM complex PTS-EIIA-like component DhaM